MMDIDLLLKQVGLRKRESQMLSYLYSKGSAKASRISKELNLPKSTILFVLYKLEGQGFITKTKKGKSYFFSPKDPTSLIQYFDNIIQEAETKKEKVIPLIPEIRRLKDHKADSKVFYYHTESSIKELRQSLIDQVDNKDTKLIYDKENVRIYANEQYLFLVTDELAVRFEDRETLIKFVNAFKYINAYEIKR
ncbi:MAG: helix-turn-helix domain-containing protein [Candidatus Dojkabacteria bacterium]|nr:helix-turn-helix domain-containing protein [Candidatus Dojkabacteria bacterium]